MNSNITVNTSPDQQIEAESVATLKNQPKIEQICRHEFEVQPHDQIQTAAAFQHCDDPYSTQSCFRQELSHFKRTFAADSKATVNWNNAALFSLALGASLGMRSGLDEQVRNNVADHPHRWGSATDGLNDLGDFRYQIPALAALYTYTRIKPESEYRDLSESLVNAYAITGLSTLAIKAIANTERPNSEWNGGDYGFPSHHVAGSFTIAAVLDEYCGPKVGIPAYLLSGLVGWSRIDAQDHDLSDVVFGASLGLIIGKSVAGNHLYGDGRVRLLPYVHPTDGSAGLMLDVPF